MEEILDGPIDETTVRLNQDLQKAIEESLKHDGVSEITTLTSVTMETPDFIRIMGDSLIPIQSTNEHLLPSNISGLIGDKTMTACVFCPAEEDEQISADIIKSIDWCGDSVCDTTGVTPFFLPHYYAEPSPLFRSHLISLVQSSKMRKMSHTTQISALNVIFGDQAGLKNADVVRWLRHPIVFCPQAHLRWCLLQFTGGPCGVLAALQGFIVQRLFFPSIIQNRELHVAYSLRNESWWTDEIKTQPDHDYSDTERHQRFVAHRFLQSNISIKCAVAEAIAFVLWQASGGQRAIVCWLAPWIDQFASGRLDEQSTHPSNTETAHTSRTINDILAEQEAFQIEFTDFEALVAYIYRYFSVLFSAPRVPGALNLVLSLVLSRGVKTIMEEDFEEEGARSLLVTFGHCRQDLVNLVLVGRACANLFNGDKILGAEITPASTESVEICVLKGIPKRSCVGYLSEMEALQYCEVGDYLKTPYYPIWVVAGSDHFSLLFSPDARLTKMHPKQYLRSLAETAFDAVCEDNSGLLRHTDVPALMKASGFAKTGWPRTDLEKRLLDHQTGNIILRSDFIEWFAEHADQSVLITNAPATEHMRRMHDVRNLTSFFPLFHYDGQLRITSCDDLPIWTDGPNLSYLSVRKLPEGCDGTNDRLLPCLSTKWSQSLEIVRADSLMHTLEVLCTH